METWNQELLQVIRSIMDSRAERKVSILTANKKYLSLSWQAAITIFLWWVTELKKIRTWGKFYHDFFSICSLGGGEEMMVNFLLSLIAIERKSCFFVCPEWQKAHLSKRTDVDWQLFFFIVQLAVYACEAPGCLLSSSFNTETRKLHQIPKSRRNISKRSEESRFNSLKSQYVSSHNRFCRQRKERGNALPGFKQPLIY